MDISKMYMTKLYLPADLAPKLWALVGGEETQDLHAGIMKAIDMALGVRNNSHDLHSL